MAKKEFYTTGEVGRMLGMSPTTIFRAIGKKRIRAATTPGGHYRITRKELEAFLKKNKMPLTVIEPRTMCVLIVEDNPAHLRMFQRALELEPDLKVVTTDSGYKAGFLTKSLKPDLILLDIFLKDMDGRKVAKLIRSDPEFAETKIVAISVAKDPKDVLKIKASGVDDFIQKPISPTELRKRVKALLE